MRLLPSVLPLSVLTGSGGSGATGGLPALRDHVPAVAPELLSVSSVLAALTAHRETARSPLPPALGVGVGECALVLTACSGPF